MTATIKIFHEWCYGRSPNFFPSFSLPPSACFPVYETPRHTMEQMSVSLPTPPPLSLSLSIFLALLRLYIWQSRRMCLFVYLGQVFAASTSRTFENTRKMNIDTRRSNELLLDEGPLGLLTANTAFMFYSNWYAPHALLRQIGNWNQITPCGDNQSGFDQLICLLYWFPILVTFPGTFHFFVIF